MGYGPPAPVQVFQHEAEFVSLLELYCERKPKRVLEVGSYHGGTLYHWLQNAEPGTGIVSLDTYTAADNRHLYKDWIPRGVELEVVAGDSHDPEIVQRISGFAPFDWIFIDADHYYPAVRADWDNFRPMCSPGAVVAFHDILTSEFHPEIEVERLWHEIQEDYETREIIEDRGAAWGGIGVVFIP